MSKPPIQTKCPILYFPKSPQERDHHRLAMPVDGHCLEPRILHGDMIIVDLDVKASIGDIVLAKQGGKLLVKILEDRGGALWLVALQEGYSCKVTDDTEILGVVVERVRRI